MKTSDFMRYTGAGPLPYKLNIKGRVEAGNTIPQDDYLPGDAWIIFPDYDASPCWSFMVFYDGTQFRVPKLPWADVGLTRGGSTCYTMESSVMSMFRYE